VHRSAGRDDRGEGGERLVDLAGLALDLEPEKIIALFPVAADALDPRTPRRAAS
jgi:hypothetical protein